jgi:hypothetical protein
MLSSNCFSEEKDNLTKDNTSLFIFSSVDDNYLKLNHSLDYHFNGLKEITIISGGKDSKSCSICGHRGGNEAYSVIKIENCEPVCVFCLEKLINESKNKI